MQDHQIQNLSPFFTTIHEKHNHRRFAAVANCGFPEARHNATAPAACAEFARSAGFEWMGALSF